MAQIVTMQSMRQTINISLPLPLKKQVDKAVKEGDYASVSEFFRDAVRAWKEDRLLREIEESRLEILQGKGKILKSLSDLD